MSSLPQVFNYQGNDFRVKLINGEPWFVVADACKALDIANVTHVIDRLDSDGVRQTEVIDSLGRKQNTTIANEPNLYRLIFRSDKPEAKPFQDWVYNEVLPSIRKTGSYSTQSAAQPSSSLNYSYSFSGSTLADIKRDQAILAHLQAADALFSGKRTVHEEKTSQPHRMALKSAQLPLEDKILRCIANLTAKGELPNVRNLLQYLKSASADQVKTCLQQLLDLGKIERFQAGKTERYRLATN